MHTKAHYVVLFAERTLRDKNGCVLSTSSTCDVDIQILVLLQKRRGRGCRVWLVLTMPMHNESTENLAYRFVSIPRPYRHTCVELVTVVCGKWKETISQKMYWFGNSETNVTIMEGFKKESIRGFTIHALCQRNESFGSVHRSFFSFPFTYLWFSEKLSIDGDEKLYDSRSDRTDKIWGAGLWIQS